MTTVVEEGKTNARHVMVVDGMIVYGAHQGIRKNMILVWEDPLEKDVTPVQGREEIHVAHVKVVGLLVIDVQVLEK